MDNPVEKILFAVQQLGDQPAMVPLIHHPVQAGGNGIVAAPLGLGQEPINDNNGAAAGEIEVPLLKAKSWCQPQMRGPRG